MTTKKTYKVTFKGVIFPGFEKDQVINNIHHVTRIPEHTIARKFFSGKTVVIRHADTQEYANSLQKTFAQAGIETYISEIYEQHKDVQPPTASKQKKKSNPTTAAPVDGRKKSHVKLIYTSIVIALIIVLASYFVLNKSPTNEKSTDKPAPSTARQIHEQPQAIPAQKNKQTQASLLTSKDIRLLIKITNFHELKHLPQFKNLFSLDLSHFELLKQAIESKDSALLITKKTPLYLFQTEHYSGLIISKIKKSSPTTLTQLKEKITKKHNDEDICSKQMPVHIIDTTQHFILTNNSKSNIHKQMQSLSKDNALNKQLFQLNALFTNTDTAFKSSFQFYYSNKSVSAKRSGNFSLSSDKHSFLLMTSPDLTDRHKELLKHLKISTKKINKLALLNRKNLFQFALLLIAQDNNNLSMQQPPTGSIFTTEQITDIKHKVSTKTIKDYQSDLDIEFNEQWQSGPFAISTNKFIFDKNLIIELAAKGQNIENLMEYSHTASISTHSIFNSQGDNIILRDCENNNSDSRFFKDLEGEHEAYVNNDFINYKTITASEQIAIKSPFKTADISKIEGKITLLRPEKILSKHIDQMSLQKMSQNKPLQFDFFSMILNGESLNTKPSNKPSNKLNYKVIGDNNHFIGIRAYNTAGEILETISLNKEARLNQQIKNYQHIFSESISSIEIFYSRNTLKHIYPFSFKPAILPAPISLNLKESKEVAYNSSAENKELPLQALSEKVLQDVPDWLGEKTAAVRKPPFYISLFMRGNETDKSNYDAVLNIKAALSPYIQQNLTAIKLILSDETHTLINNYISFNSNEFFDESIMTDSSSSGISPISSAYLNSNSAFQINSDKTNTLQGKIITNFATSFKTHTSSYLSPGQIIKLDQLMLTVLEIDKHHITFKIKGEIDKLVQLKLYDKENTLISEPFEFNLIDKESALLSLRYNKQINSIKLILSQKSIMKNYSFSLNSLNSKLN